MSALKPTTVAGLQRFSDHIGRPNTTISSVIDYAKATDPDADLADKVTAGVTGVLSVLDFTTSLSKSFPAGAGVTLAIDQLSNDVAKLVLEGANNAGAVSNLTTNVKSSSATKCKQDHRHAKK